MEVGATAVCLSQDPNPQPLGVWMGNVIFHPRFGGGLCRFLSLLVVPLLTKTATV